VSKNENIYDKIQEMFGPLPGSFNILEEQIDIDLQMEYFEYTRKLKKPKNINKTLKKKEILFGTNVDLKKKKRVLAELALLNNTEAYRLIEQYVAKPDPELRNWAILALQEGRMLLESNLLDENQILISTGLGGKGSKLRYFIVLLARAGKKVNALHEKIIRNEVDSLLSKYDSEMEEICFAPNFVTMMVIIPLHITIREMFAKIIDECNIYGNFLQPDFIVTNVKTLSNEEIIHFMNKNPA